MRRMRSTHDTRNARTKTKAKEYRLKITWRRNRVSYTGWTRLEREAIIGAQHASKQPGCIRVEIEEIERTTSNG